MEKIKNLPSIADKKKEDEVKIHRMERILTCITKDGWEDVKEFFLKEAQSDELKELLAHQGATEFEKIGQLTYLEQRANDKIKRAISKLEKFKG